MEMSGLFGVGDVVAALVVLERILEQDATLPVTLMIGLRYTSAQVRDVVPGSVPNAFRGSALNAS